MSTAEDPSAVYRRYLSAVLLHAQASARAVGLGATDLYALNILELHGAMTPSELGRLAGLTTGPTTRLVDRLEEGGYVRRAPDPGDRRKVVVQPLHQPEGLDKALAPARDSIGEILRGYRPEEVAVLFDYFARAADAYQHATDQLTEL
ncbi:MarR family winged helix-turn-helix transcriptional regulator [Amycolatopsis sp. VS8301801F10]|uniref:MarR family winged helix-turn-helix transcriptional regulator n=1 Tax=Amycolatopsis sp. VS8301801F10 TaxID=2652442 RepID=UPI0038FC26F2